jgi:demethylmenaquinone methyltransferase/2-methoxy-6-polyprenyl-1,4-benzoquinol methylase|tara:strand:- start:192 stop:938 length:747 start_codon:yes stop_codon:yes gene_type:complete
LQNKYTDFGFSRVKSKDKSNLVKKIFENVSGRYDLMNDFMSLGIHRVWKKSMLDWLAPRRGQSLIDVAGGTGDIAFNFIKRAKTGANATILDLTESMMIEGKKKTIDLPEESQINWVCGDAMRMPFSDSTFDVYTISFGIRNVTNISKTLSEAYRVLKPGGRLMILEFSSVNNDLISWIYDKYSFNIIPKLGEFVSNDRESYQYLVESIRKFPNQEKFSEMIINEGFRKVKYRDLTFGIAALHSAWKF